MDIETLAAEGDPAFPVLELGGTGNVELIDTLSEGFGHFPEGDPGGAAEVIAQLGDVGLQGDEHRRGVGTHGHGRVAQQIQPERRVGDDGERLDGAAGEHFIGCAADFFALVRSDLDGQILSVLAFRGGERYPLAQSGDPPGTGRGHFHIESGTFGTRGERLLGEGDGAVVHDGRGFLGVLTAGGEKQGGAKGEDDTFFHKLTTR